ncbi:Mitochondrial acidic protein mam33 [Malassezia japonica]|uniref:Mitochondrial acidic protein mam33 n=1 Tax=Malassezia japonica TaxID=223818 RepID=A0AAF0J9N6_9BASI|nr:Mitochondrial acidic protein mam33 [Malassezia japonica]WFD38415.1 Mitochondrial acidic protein mam33 [Malassezia japonica]
MSSIRAGLCRLPAVSRASLARGVRASAMRVPSAARVAAPSLRTFATTLRRSGQGESDAELAASLQQEISYEKEAAEAAGSQEHDPEWLTQFKSEGVWHIEDKSGSDEIALTREFGSENIRVLFSIGEIDTTDPTNELEQDEADQMTASGEDEFEGSFPVRCAINVTKANKGSLNIDAQAQDGQFMIENITFYKDDVLATELTSDADWQRRGLYMGPQFETLDENVQAQFESYLAERGIATGLALFIPNYAELKEQREYCSWLEHVKEFVEA